MSERRVCVGAIAGSYGVRGEVRLKSFCAEADAIGGYSPLQSEDGKREFTIRITGAIKAGFVARIDGVKSKEAADQLRGTRLYVSRDRLPDLDDDEYYHSDLIGLIAFDTGGTEIGRVKAVLDHGAGDLLELHGRGMKDTILLPFTQAIVPTVDLAAGRIVIDPPDGIIGD